MKSDSTIRSVIIPCGDQKVLLPNAAVAEIIRYEEPMDIPQSPAWLAGVLMWRQQALPVISYEYMNNDKQTILGFKSRLSVCYCFSGDSSKIQFFALIAKTTPTLLLASEENIESTKNQENLDKTAHCRVVVAGEEAIIPDLLELENMLGDYVPDFLKYKEDYLSQQIKPVAVKKPKLKKLILEDVDEEIVEIFIEEAQENIEVINEFYPQWKANNANEEALTTFRRSFHTIKGSGRMVKVDFISELAWAVENMLNRYIDGTIKVTPSMLAVIDETVNVLPTLMGFFIQRVHPDFDLQTLMDQANALSHGETIDDVLTVDTKIEKAVESIEESTVVDVEPTNPHEMQVEADDIDEETLEIFLEEAEELMDAIEGQLQEWQAEPAEEATISALHRTLHTLKGGARMSGLIIIGNLSHTMESLLTAVNDDQVEANEDIIKIILKSADALTEMLNRVKEGEIPTSDNGIIYELEQFIKTKPVEDIPVQIDSGEPDEEEEEEEEVDEELLEIFVEEAKEIIETMENSLREWDDNREDHGVIEDLQRSLHTIKGGARMAGIIAIGDLCHSIESMLSAIIDETLDLNDEIFQLTMQVYDFLVDDIEKVENNEKVEKRKEYIDKIHKMTG
ncbi:MAG: hypothetical protein HON94_12080 [Methylococcales bacterium]|jgi:chemosensory pili system protein ChpA (sensor histidine kinase/response regulator)|nr:hypothetical protein [Methylococcales bacterium]MBT7410187.1 hypothetical protein [Methylococcales bacterium]